MSPEKQLIAIAEYCGWKRSPAHDFNTFYETVEIWAKGNRLSMFENLPNYLNDWNAMHDAVGSLPSLEKRRFLANLELITRKPAASHWFDMRIIDATLEEYAQAILRTIGKWEES